MLRSVVGLLFVALIWVSKADDAYLELTADNFESEMKKHDLALVKFYAEWCGHCKRMAPEFAKAAELLKKNNPPVQLVKVNCPNHQSLCEKFSVSGYPTLKIFRKGEISEDYNGGRESQDIVKYMKSRAGPASTLLNSGSEIKKFRDGTSTVFVGFFPSESDSDFLTFKKIAEKSRDDFTFTHVFSDNKHIRRYLPNAIQTKIEDEYAQINLPASQNDIEKWIKESWGGLLSWKDGNSKLFDEINENWVTISFKLDYERDPKGSNYIRNRLLKAIKDLKKDGVKCKFAMASAADPKQQHALSNDYGITWNSGDKPVVTVIAKGKKYVMKDEFSYDNLKKFVKEFENGAIEEHLKSEPIPDSQPDAVVKLVARNFDEIVRDTSKYALVEFFAPWCGHCKSLKPIYEELAQKLKGDTDIVIAAMDATANDVPSDFAVSGFPTLYWVDKSNGIKQYSSGRDLESFVKFIEAEVGHKVGAKDEL